MKHLEKGGQKSGSQKEFKYRVYTVHKLVYA